MPHLVIEYSANLPDFDAAATLAACNGFLAGTGHFSEADIKSRSIRHEHFLVGTASDGRAFVHATLWLLSGRPENVKQALSRGVLEAIEQNFNKPDGLDVQLSVQMQDMERSTYAKAFL
ncbi:5-carboxymethyl-2-hydroxymuconate Delta-isomerase [Pseudomonas sp. BN515]|uniref:5-carboxymethyl-2-hydroxymuconate Delta-isomerase n=1 Tax=Pseudomonas sp. BN515 TaxID=2567892 RepID=UPI0024582183|nr:5-carboxymethyl-2-hydroxymuconate Delta-isomerase [Pseudomonas sp. BN515]MDH4872188.1 5-carboxymethyl-2-hydroxymuconate Delta-isomerase [Pseudomonas sp. BN515]